MHISRLTLMVVAATVATQAAALDFNGYLRAGPVLSGAEPSGTRNAAGVMTPTGQTYGHYSLGGAGQMYRLGNEGDFYGEFLLSHKLLDGSQQVTVGWMPTVWSAMPNPLGTGDNNGKSATYDTAQLYAELTGMDFAPNAKFWAGKRYLQRADVHIVDTFYINYTTNVGAGAYNLDMGNGAKLGVNVFSSDEFNGNSSVVNANTHTMITPVKATAARITADLADVRVSSDGRLRVLGTVVSGDYLNGNTGTALTLKHDQANFIYTNLINSVWLQAAQGHAALNMGFADLKHNAVRAIDSVDWQIGAWGGEAQAVYERDKVYQDISNAGVNTVRTSLGGRLTYAVTRNFKMQGEIGLTTAKQDGVSGTANLNKITIAPTITYKSADFWSRPELRFYFTHVSWNDAASQLVGATPYGLIDKSNPALPSGKRAANLIGVQAEAWF